MLKKLVLVINGQALAGKDTFVSAVSEHWPTMFAAIADAVKRVALQCGWDGGKTAEDRRFLSDLKCLLDGYHDWPYQQLMAAYYDFLENDDRILFLQLREPADIRRFLDDSRHDSDIVIVKTLFLERESRRTVGNIGDDSVYDFDYDFVVKNDGTVDDLKHKAVQLVSSLLA